MDVPARRKEEKMIKRQTTPQSKSTARGNLFAHVYKPCFRASLTPEGEFEVLVYETIGEDFWTGEGITAKSIRQAMAAAGDFSKISLRINSPGGDVFEGIAIGNMLKSAGKPIDVFVDGIAASAASILAMCGDTVTMAHNAMMMIHNAWSVCVGDQADMTDMADRLGKISAAIAQTYADATGKPIEEVSAMMDAETWMSADECMTLGFATAVTEESDEPAMAMARGFKLLGKLKSLPESLRARAEDMDKCECVCEACQAGNCEDCSNLDCKDENCEGCPMQEANASNLSLFEAEAWLLQNAVCDTVC